MMVVFITFLDYKPGDEDIVLNSSLIATSALEVTSDSNHITVFPKPTDGKLLLAIDQTSLIDLVLSNSEGQVVKSWNESAENSKNLIQEIDISDLNSGRYFLVVIGESCNEVKKVVLNKLR